MMKSKFYLGALLLGCGSIWANPSGDTLVSGTGFSVNNPDAYHCEISAESTRTIVNWESFSIGSGQTTTITLPSSSAAILNRVTSEEISNLNGTLESNGQVFLINPSGIVIGSGAAINTSAFLASTLDADDGEFLSGNEMTFTGTENPDVYVVQSGTIDASDGDVFLLSYQIVNNGEINAENGTIALGVGVEILLTPTAEQKIGIVAHTPQLEALGTGIDDSGTLTAITAELKAQGNLYATAINHTGWVSTISNMGAAHVRVTGDGGYVLANGLISSSNGNSGGQIDVMGQSINLDNTCVLDVSSSTGLGVINVGQGLSGDDPDFILAEEVTMGSGAYLNANTLYYGEGGQVAIWADKNLTVAGTVEAAGGFYSGDGGLVVFGSNDGYSFTGTVDVSSPTGDPGTFIHP